MKFKKYVVAVTGCVMVLGSSFTAFRRKGLILQWKQGQWYMMLGQKGFVKGLLHKIALQQMIPKMLYMKN